MSPAELVEVKRQVTELLQKQLIEPSVSLFGAHCLLKKIGELEMVIDHQALNLMTVKNCYPLPRIDDLSDKLQGSQFFTSLDAGSSFHPVLLQESDHPKTAFSTPFGHYQFRVLPFGLKNAPATFQAAMDKVFNPNKYEADGTINPLAELSDFVLVLERSRRSQIGLNLKASLNYNSSLVSLTSSRSTYKAIPTLLCPSLSCSRSKLHLPGLLLVVNPLQM